MSEALHGVRVLELADRSATLAGRILADLGAQVILVEPPEGCGTRHEGPFYPLHDSSTSQASHRWQDRLADAPERSFAHLYFNTNKRSVVVDLACEAGRLEFMALVAGADVLLDTKPPGWLDDLGLGHAALRSVKPDLIQCSVTPFGLTTPWRQRKANDLVAGAAGGLIQVSGEPRGTPVQGGANPSYTMSGLAAASSILIALHQRDFGLEADRGHGIHIDLSMQEATALAVMQTASPGQWQWHGRIPRRPGLSAAMACRDGKYVSLLVRPDRFESFLAWAERVGIDHGMTLDDWHWARLESPRKNNPVAATTLAIAAALTRDEFVDGALEADIICLPVLDFPDLEKHPQYQLNEQFLTLAHESLGAELGYVRSPVDAMADGVTFRRAPELGEDQNLLESLAQSGPPSAPSPKALPPKALPPKAPPPKTEEPLHTPHPRGALAGLRVVDFGWVLAAPIGTRMLASFGAEVIRVESSNKPDSMRSQVGPDGKLDADLGGLFNVVNAGKKSLSVDLTRPEGLELVKKLIATADIVVNNFRPGALEKMGLGYQVLRELKEDIVLLNLPGAHRVAPWAQRPSMGNILMAASGFNMLTGFAGERPRGIGIAYPDFTSPHLLVTTVLAAIRQRNDHKRGQELHLTQLSAVLSLLGAEWMAFKATGKQPARNANRSENHAPHGIYPALDEVAFDIDGWVAIAVATDAEWRGLCAAMGQTALAQDPRFATLASRKLNEDELDTIVGDWTRQRDKWEIADLLQQHGVAAAPVEHLKDMLETDPQLPDHYQQVRQPVAPAIDIPVDREAARWVGHTLDLQRSPGLGEHNQYVVQELLGYTDATFVQLMVDGILV